MCGRFVLYTKPKKIAEHLSAHLQYEFRASYNIAPTQIIAALIAVDHERLIVPFRWGLIPSWYREDSEYTLPLMINAKSETIDSKPSFRHAFREHRCLILADGYYEWHTEEKVKQPYYFHLKNNSIIAMAGIWERSIANGKSIDTCCIITIPSNKSISNIHHRMPAIIAPDDYDSWLKQSLQDASKIKKLLNSNESSKLVWNPVSTTVNKTKNNTADLIHPLNPNG